MLAASFFETCMTSFSPPPTARSKLPAAPINITGNSRSSSHLKTRLVITEEGEWLFRVMQGDKNYVVLNEEKLDLMPENFLTIQCC